MGLKMIIKDGVKGNSENHNYPPNMCVSLRICEVSIYLTFCGWKIEKDDCNHDVPRKTSSYSITKYLIV